ncbi:MAG: phycobilisome linker polypeptide [Leptolyngbya sp. Prado105]|jgi:hypothetical protein|nr:phycobilisome linker polypeptide [Leptolyngbya sp. Prado105]
MAETVSLMKTSGSNSDDRIFVYEVEGLRQTSSTQNQAFPVRTSSTVLIQVPYSRMNEEMQRINRLGGKIVNIRPSADSAASDE